MTHRLAIVVSHPIQHFVPFYRALSAESDIDLTVLFGSRKGLEPYFDVDLNTALAWKMDLLSGYHQLFLSDEAEGRSAPAKQSRLAAELTRSKPDAVLIYGYNQALSRGALHWCRRHRVPAIMISDAELRSVRSVWKLVFKRFLVTQILRRFSAFLTVGDNNEDYYRHYGVPSERLFRSPFTIDEDAYRAARADRENLRAKVRAELGIPAGSIIALTVGKLSSRKRPGDVVDAARILAGNRLPRPVHFVLAGNGKDLEQLKDKAQALPVTFAGFVNVDRLPEFYAAADMIVHPSAQDPHPLVMSEGACIGLPLIVSSCVGAVGELDIARSGQNTLVFPVGDVTSLANSVAALSKDPAKLEAMSKASIRIFEELDMRRSIAGARAALTHVRS